MAKVSLILEGGGMRGLYTAGVLDYFMDQGLIFQDIIGVSAGACNSVSYISGQRGRNLDINAGFCSDKRYLSLLGLFTRGSVFNLDFLFDDIPNRLLPFDYNSFKNSECRLTAVSTDCSTGRPMYTPIRDMLDDGIYVRASSSIPLVSPIVEVEGKMLVDGGPSDSIPIRYSVDCGFDAHIVIMTQHGGYRKKKSNLYPLYRLLLRKYPNLVNTIRNRPQVYNESIDLAEELEKQNKAVIIRPKQPVQVSRFERNPENLKKLYKDGYEDAAEKFENILQLCRDFENISYKSC
ncbi:NTE family protein RssA [Ruminiclostridium hungatei]|uniref:NTE family protein RssA n=1 Tax=Ruminiclostridium hungatei TaxID=48256 RepID=A0A1V4SR72_RUMHU|nr:patatin family protein [Ruminiclostridium hungatei]OPX46283.1 NTE family protein RssA [Ruminiclostridium hungatei]